jgi:hypothetical protein
MFNNNIAPQRLGEQPRQLTILQPGAQGWKNPQPVPILIGVKSNLLTRKQLQEGFKIPNKHLAHTPVGVALLWQSYIIWHQGRDRWSIYQPARV